VRFVQNLHQYRVPICGPGYVVLTSDDESP
jgi:hypothetical protein